MSKKRWVLALFAAVGLGFVLLLVAAARPPVEAGADSPDCNLEAGYCPRRPG